MRFTSRFDILLIPRPSYCNFFRTTCISEVCFNATISACGKSKLWETSLYVLADIDRRPIVANCSTCRNPCASHRCCRVEQSDTAPTLDCRECLQKDLFSYNTSFSAVAVAELLSKFNEQQNQECAKTLRL